MAAKNGELDDAALSNEPPKRPDDIPFEDAVELEELPGS